MRHFSSTFQICGGKISNFNLASHHGNSSMECPSFAHSSAQWQCPFGNHILISFFSRWLKRNSGKICSISRMWNLINIPPVTDEIQSNSIRVFIWITINIKLMLVWCNRNFKLWMNKQSITALWQNYWLHLCFSFSLVRFDRILWLSLSLIKMVIRPQNHNTQSKYICFV